MSHLLHVSRLPSKAVMRKGVLPLMVEFTVPEETGPYLVSSSASVLWINEAQPGGLVNAAVRAVSLGDFFQEVLLSVAAMGRNMEWGNVHPLTVEGLQAAIDHVSSYELEPLELLIPRAHPFGSTPLTEEDHAVNPLARVSLLPDDIRPLLAEFGLPFRPCAWIPDGTIVVVPKDRLFVGVVSQVTAQKLAGVVHNAARGIGIAQGGVGALADRSLPGPDPE